MRRHSWDNLPFDILLHVFFFIPHRHFASCALVSCSFYAAVSSRLYARIEFGAQQAARSRILTPFQVLARKPALAVFVHSWDISSLPFSRTGPDATFLNQCAGALELCTNLVSFTCTSNIASAALLPSLLPVLSAHSRLKHLRIHAPLKSDTINVLSSFRGLQSLHLKQPSNTLLGVLPQWFPHLGSTLTSYSISKSSISIDLLELILSTLPALESLSILDCPNIAFNCAFNLASRCDLTLNSLSITSPNVHGISESPLPIAGLHCLRRLSVDVTAGPNMVYNSTEAQPELTAWKWALNSVAGSSLEHLTLSKRSSLVSFPSDLIEKIATEHQALKVLHVSGASINLSRISRLCQECVVLESLSFPILGVKLIKGELGQALSRAPRLRTLIDTSTSTVPIKPDDVRALLRVVPNIRNFFNNKNHWHVEKSVQRNSDSTLAFATIISLVPKHRLH